MQESIIINLSSFHGTSMAPWNNQLDPIKGIPRNKETVPARSLNWMLCDSGGSWPASLDWQNCRVLSTILEFHAMKLLDTDRL